MTHLVMLVMAPIEWHDAGHRTLMHSWPSLHACSLACCFFCSSVKAPLLHLTAPLPASRLPVRLVTMGGHCVLERTCTLHHAPQVLAGCTVAAKDTAKECCSLLQSSGHMHAQHMHMSCLRTTHMQHMPLTLSRTAALRVEAREAGNSVSCRAWQTLPNCSRRTFLVPCVDSKGAPSCWSSADAQGDVLC